MAVVSQCIAKQVKKSIVRTHLFFFMSCGHVLSQSFIEWQNRPLAGRVYMRQVT